MKARPFLASLLAVLLLALSLGAAGWWLVWQRSPLQLQHRALLLPRAARFIPRDAALSLHWLSDGREPVGYARAVAPARSRREAAEAIARLRDGAFAAAGLDYDNELAGWLAPEISLALFDPPRPAAAGSSGAADSAEGGSWLLALRSRDASGARRFLQRFWQTRSLAGTDLQVSSYRGMGLISGRAALVGSRPVPLATALIDDDLLLLASGRGVLEEALDVSQIAELNQASDPALGAGLAQLGSAAALLVANPGAGSPWPDGPLLAALRPEGANLRLEALLSHPIEEAWAQARFDAGLRRRLLAVAPPRTASLALLQDPAMLRRDPLLGPLLERMLPAGPHAGLLPPLVVERADGPLLAIDLAGDWLLATPAGSPPAAALEAPLAAAGLIPAPLELEGRSVTVWTRLVASASRASRSDRDRLQAPLEGWRGERDGVAVWGGSLAQLEADPVDRGSRLRERQLEALGSREAPLQWALDGRAARSLLAGWDPWRRLAALAGGPLEGSVAGLSLALEPSDGSLRLHGRLEFGAAR